jgi:hypothetical protein
MSTGTNPINKSSISMQPFFFLIISLPMSITAVLIL